MRLDEIAGIITLTILLTLCCEMIKIGIQWLSSWRQFCERRRMKKITRTWDADILEQGAGMVYNSSFFQAKEWYHPEVLQKLSSGWIQAMEEGFWFWWVIPHTVGVDTLLQQIFVFTLFPIKYYYYYYYYYYYWNLRTDCKLLKILQILCCTIIRLTRMSHFYFLTG